MKIYAATRELSFYDLIGKDVWVKCYHKIDEDLLVIPQKFYVKVLYLDENEKGVPVFKCNAIDCDYVARANEYEHLSAEKINSFINKIEEFPEDEDNYLSLVIQKPIQALTTEEIIEAMSSNEDEDNDEDEYL